VTDRGISVTSFCILKHGHESLFYTVGDLTAGNIPSSITSMQRHKFHTLGRERKWSRGKRTLSYCITVYK